MTGDRTFAQAGDVFLGFALAGFDQFCGEARQQPPFPLDGRMSDGIRANGKGFRGNCVNDGKADNISGLLSIWTTLISGASCFLVLLAS